MNRLSTLSRSVAGSTAIVTGAASGMGRATAHLFADEGMRVAVVDLDAERVLAVADEIRSVHGSEAVVPLACDVGDAGALSEMVAATVARFGGIDVLINNAGVSLVNSAFQDEESYELNWARTLDINLTAHSRLVRLCLPHLQASAAAGGSPRIVNIASTESIVASAGMTAYAASKAGVAGLTRSLAVELGRHGITVNCICPGPILTGMTAAIPDEAKQVYAKRRVPLRRYGIPEEVAQMSLNLCLPASSFVNGAVIPVDGGMTVRHT